MREYRLKQAPNVWDSLEAAFYAAVGLGLLLTENGWGMAGGLILFAVAAWSLWRDFDRRCREIVFSECEACPCGTALIHQVSRRNVRTLPLSDFCGVATFSDTQRGRVGNVYHTALVSKQPHAAPLTVHTVVQSFARPPALPPEAADQVRRRIAECTGLQDFGDVGAAVPTELYAKCRVFK